jgi:RNA polymerase sporulation-specific sigma factor
MIFENFMTFMNKIMLFSSYVNNASGFPKPLSSEEENKYLLLAKNGDEKAKEILINHNLRLVAHIVKKYTNAGEADDLISAGSIGLIKAINTYSIDKNTQLSTYAARCIENEILMLIRVNKKHNNDVSINESLGCDKDGNEISLIDVIPSENSDVSNNVENTILTDSLIQIMKSILSDREYEIMKLRFGIGGTPTYTQREVAKKLGISRSYISRLETKSISEIKKAVKDNDLFVN